MDSENIIIKNFNGLNYLQFKVFNKLGIKHAYTLKSEGFDFGHNTAEEQHSYETLCNALNIETSTLVKPFQTHTANVKCMNDMLVDLNDVDGLITDKKNIALTSKNADCILFLFYDPIKKVIANIHSGWRGTFQKIAEKTVIKMISNYGSEPENIICCICPSIRECHFEVDDDVKNLCLDIFGFTGKTDKFIKLGEVKAGKQKYLIDTVKINKILLEELGLKKENIVDCNICSVCNKDFIHSVRVEGKSYKRATAVIIL